MQKRFSDRDEPPSPTERKLVVRVRQAQSMTSRVAATLNIRAELDNDRDVIRTLIAAAFDPDDEVAGLVDALRRSPAFIPGLSLVATVEGAVVGHVLLTAAVLVDERGLQHRVLVLSPLSVLPQQQRRGIGAALVRKALARADAEGEELVVLQGSPRYYPRFGFRDSRTLGVAMELPDWAPPEAGMACPLSAYRPSTRGRLIESQPFLDLTH
jgi:putative acetyltransferase